jgi:hypothetical protein
VEPQLHVVQQVEGGEHHSLVLWHPVNVEVALASAELGQGIAGAIEFQEFELVGRCGEVTARRIAVFVTALPLVRLMLWMRGALGALCLYV